MVDVGNCFIRTFAMDPCDMFSDLACRCLNILIRASSFMRNDFIKSFVMDFFHTFSWCQHHYFCFLIYGNDFIKSYLYVTVFASL